MPMDTQTITFVDQDERRSARRHEIETRLQDWLSTGDSTAFEGLRDKMSPVLYCYCRQLGLRHEDAQDAVQDTWLNILRFSSRIKTEENTYAFVFQIAHNCSMNWYRRAKKFHEPRTTSLDDADNTINVTSAGNPEEDCDREDTRRKVHQALKEVPEIYRTPLVLLFLAELKREEVASILAISPGTLASRLFEARRQMAVALNKVGFPGEVYVQPRSKETKPRVKAGQKKIMKRTRQQEAVDGKGASA